MPSVHMNWVTIIAASVVAFAVGAVWYSPPVFGKIYSAVAGKMPSPPTLALSFLLTIVSASMLAVVVSWTGAAGFSNGVLVGVVGWAAYAGATNVANMAFEPNRSKLTVVNSGFQLIQFVILGAAIAHWR